MRKLHLYELHKLRGAKFAPFAGWEMPVAYGSAIEEHLGVRSSVRMFDVSHMGEIEVSGPGAIEALNFSLTNDVRKCKAGQAQYTLLCTEEGGVIDDLILYRKTDENFLLCVNATNIENDFDALIARCENFDCTIRNSSDEFGQIAIQGPASAQVVMRALKVNVANLNKMNFLSDIGPRREGILARTGYTGEDGFEIYYPLIDLEELANDLEKAGAQWAGLAARDSLRLEAGFPLYGHELNRNITPVQAGLEWAVTWSKNDFVGLRALCEERTCGPAGRIGHYVVEDRRIPRQGDPVIDNLGRPVGRVLSGGFSPSLGKPIGTAWIDKESWGKRNESGWTSRLRNQDIPISFGPPAIKLCKAQ